MPERQPVSDKRPSRLSGVVHNKLFRIASGTGALGAVAALSIAGGDRVQAKDYTPVLDNNDSHTQPVDNSNLSNLLDFRGSKLEVVGLPQFRTVLSSELDAGYLASRLGDEITFAVPEGSNVNDQIHDQIKAKTGADLDGADTWKVVTEVGGSEDNLVFPGQVKSYKVNEEVVSTIRDANVAVEVTGDPLGETEAEEPDVLNVVDGGSGSETSASALESTSGCIVTDLKGNFDWAGDSERHLVNDPATFHLQNIATDTTCDKTVWIHGFATDEAPKLPDGSDNPEWLTSQRYVTSASYDIEHGAQDQRESFDIPDVKECYVQIDLVRTGEVRIPPLYNSSDNSMIDYGIWENPECKVTPSATATATSTVTFTATPTATSTEVPVTETATNTPTSTNTPETPTVTFTPTSTPTMSPGEFPDCELQIAQPGDKAHYETGTHWIPGSDVLLVGEDDVYTLSDGNYLQCYCPPDEQNVDGDEGIQTNWLNSHSETKPDERAGFYLVWGPDFGLDESWFYASGAEKPTPITPNFDCDPKEPTETPTNTPTATATATATPTYTASASPTNTPTATATSAETRTHRKKTPTPTSTATSSPTSTPTNTPVSVSTEAPAVVEPILPNAGSGDGESDSTLKMLSIAGAFAGVAAVAAGFGLRFVGSFQQVGANSEGWVPRRKREEDEEEKKKESEWIKN